MNRSDMNSSAPRTGTSSSGSMDNSATGQRR
jgi:hypothetical protein